MNNERRSEADLTLEERVEYEKSKRFTAEANAIKPDHEVTPEEGALWLLRQTRLSFDAFQGMNDAEYDAYHDAPATEEEKREVKRMLAREGEWADPAQDEDSRKP